MRHRMRRIAVVALAQALFPIAGAGMAWASGRIEVGLEEEVEVLSPAGTAPGFTIEAAKQPLKKSLDEIRECIEKTKHHAEGEAKLSIEVNAVGATTEIRTLDSNLPEHAQKCIEEALLKMKGPASATPDAVTAIVATFKVKPAFDYFEYASTVTNFIIMFGFLAFVLKRPLVLFLEARRENMATALREAKAKQAEAEKRLEDFGHKLDHLEDEVARIVTAYEKEAEADRERLKQDADRAIERLVRETEFTIRQEARKAEKAIRESAVQATLEAAEELVRARITEADHRRLADAYITSLGQKN